MDHLKIKAAMAREGLYRGDASTEEWGSEEAFAWRLYCDRWGGNYTADPSPHQPSEFLERIESAGGKEQGTEEPAPKPHAVKMENLAPETQKPIEDGGAPPEFAHPEKGADEHGLELANSLRADKGAGAPSAREDLAARHKGGSGRKNEKELKIR